MFVYKLLWSALCIKFSHGDPFMMTNRPHPWRYLYDTWAPSMAIPFMTHGPHPMSLNGNHILNIPSHQPGLIHKWTNI